MTESAEWERLVRAALQGAGGGSPEPVLAVRDAGPDSSAVSSDGPATGRSGASLGVSRESAVPPAALSLLAVTQPASRGSGESGSPLNAATERADAPEAASAASPSQDPALARLLESLERLRDTTERQAGSVQENTDVLSSVARQVGQGALAGVGKAVASAGKSGVGSLLSPLVTGLFKLFRGGGGSEAPPPLTPFSLPEPVRWQEGVGGARQVPVAVDYGQNGLPRAISPATPAAAPVQVVVNAMDSRSFLDHSAEIAQAVRRAMLESHALNDVVGEL